MNCLSVWRFLVILLVGSAVAVGQTCLAQAPLGPAKTDSAVTLKGTGGYVRLDLTQKDDKTHPVLKLGYQTQTSEQLKRIQLKDPTGKVHHLPLYSADIAGTASNGSASIFNGSNATTGADIKISYGQAYLVSYIPSSVSIDLRADLRFLKDKADLIETAKLAAPSDPRIADARQDVVVLQQDVETISGIAELLGDQTTVAQAATMLVYADNIIVYADTIQNSVTKPTLPDFTSLEAPRKGPLYDALVFQVGYSRSAYTLYTPDSTKAFAGQFTNKDFDGYSAQVGYNVNFGGRFPLIVGVAVGGGRYNNADSLFSVKVTDTNSTTTTTQTETGVSTVTHATIDDRARSRDRTGLVGDYKVSTLGTAKFDIVLYPEIMNASKDGKNPRASVALDFFGRAKGGTPFVYGVGAYITQPGAPQKVYGGLNLYRNEEKKFTIDIVAGLPF